MKPTIMILGSPHLANPGADVYNTKIDDVLTPKRQDEISELVRLILVCSEPQDFCESNADH